VEPKDLKSDWTNFWVTIHVGKQDRVTQFTDALKTLNVECAVRIDKESKQDAAIRTLRTTSSRPDEIPEHCSSFHKYKNHHDPIISKST
jgi:hypothetical protein